MSGTATAGFGRVTALLIGAVIFAAATLTGCQPVQKCNGYAALCDRAFDAVSYATTHNAMGNAADFQGPNQEYDITRQLNDGVRGLMLDTHYNSGSGLPDPEAPNGVPLSCHTFCLNGWRLLSDDLGKIKAFLDAHPNDVVTIIFETYVSAADTKAAFDLSGATNYVATHTPGAAWPTLRQMIASNQRLVVMTDRDGGTYPWYLPVWSEAFDNPYSALVPADLSCNLNRGNGNNRLFILNNFLTDLVGRRTLADQVNFNPSFLARAQACQTARSHLPNFVTVDFYDRGDVMSVVRSLNGV